MPRWWHGCKGRACLRWLEDEIGLVEPQAIVAMGATAARSLLGRAVAVMSERGQWFDRPADGRPVLVTLHPSALLRVLDREEGAAAYARWVDDLRQAARYLAPRRRAGE